MAREVVANASTGGPNDGSYRPAETPNLPQDPFLGPGSEACGDMAFFHSLNLFRPKHVRNPSWNPLRLPCPTGVNRVKA